MKWQKAACRTAEESLSQPVLEIQLLRTTPEHREMNEKHTHAVDVVANPRLFLLSHTYLD